MNKRIRKAIAVIILLFSCAYVLTAQNVKNPLSFYSKGLELENEESWFAAAQEFHQVITLNPAFSDAWFHLASCSYKLAEYELALDYIEQAERLEKDKSQIQNLRGMILLALGRISDSKEIFTSILEKYPNDVNAHFGLAEIELYDGKFSGAEQQYAEALRRQNTNRKALLSMALVCAETGRFAQAESYLRQAMQFYSGDCEVHYLASLIYFMKSNYSDAEKHARIAVELNGDFIIGYELLSSILYSQGKYEEVIDISDFLIGRNRNNGKAWYLKGIAQNRLGRIDDAINTWNTGLTVSPQDEIMRTQMELVARNSLPLDDKRREEWAAYHLVNAQQYESRFDKPGAVYEYQRALLLNPKNVKARLSYADNLDMKGMHELYLEQISFIEENSPEVLTQNLKDKIEGYKSLLGTTTAKKWNVEPFYLDKIRWNIAIFYTTSSSTFNHADTARVTAEAASDIFSGVAITSVKTHVTPVSGYSEAFKNARSAGFDYFIILDVSESEEDITLKANMFTGRTGIQAGSGFWFATGNNRFSTVLRRFRNSVLDKLTVRGKILSRNGKQVLVDLGKSENIQKDYEFKIIKRGGLKIADNQAGLTYKNADVVGSLKITNASEEVSEADITEHGFYDRVNVGDEIILVKIPEQKEANGIDTVPNADENGNTVVNNNESEGKGILEEIRKAVEKPAIIEILHSIY